MFNVDAALRDKTGTLTKGDHAVTSVATTDGDEAKLLALGHSGGGRP